MFDSAETMRESELGNYCAVEHDGFQGHIIGHYTTREGKEGVVVQQINTRVVHVYGRKWIEPKAALSASGKKSDGSRVRQVDNARSHGEGLQYGPDTTITTGTDASSIAAKVRDDGNVVNQVEASGRAPHVLLGPSDPILSQPDEREAIAETIWRAEYRRATGRERSIPWSEASPIDQERYRYVASAIIAMQAERRGATRPTIPICCVTGAIPGDGGACGDCDPCTLGGGSVPDAVKRLIAEKNSLLQRVGELEAQPATIAGLEPVAWRSPTDVPSIELGSSRDGDGIKGWRELPQWGDDQFTRAQLEAHAAEQVRPLVEALEGLIEAVELDADEGLEGIGSYTGARLTDAKNAIRARGQK